MKKKSVLADKLEAEGKITAALQEFTKKHPEFEFDSVIIKQERTSSCSPIRIVSVKIAIT